MKLNGEQYEAENEIRSTEKRIENLLMDKRRGSKYQILPCQSFILKEKKKQKNKIWRVLNQHNVWTEDEEEVDWQFCEYFETLFSTSSPTNESILDALVGLTPTVTT